MEYHSAIKKNKIMPLAATWMDLEIVKCSEVSQKEEKYILTHVCGMVLFSHSVMSDSLQSHRLQHARLPCPSLSPRACSNSYSSSW